MGRRANGIRPDGQIFGLFWRNFGEMKHSFGIPFPAISCNQFYWHLGTYLRNLLKPTENVWVDEPASNSCPPDPDYGWEGGDPPVWAINGHNSLIWSHRLNKWRFNAWKHLNLWPAHFSACFTETNITLEIILKKEHYDKKWFSNDNLKDYCVFSSVNGDMVAVCHWQMKTCFISFLQWHLKSLTRPFLPIHWKLTEDLPKEKNFVLKNRADNLIKPEPDTSPVKSPHQREKIRLNFSQFKIYFPPIEQQGFDQSQSWNIEKTLKCW